MRKPGAVLSVTIVTTALISLMSLLLPSPPRAGLEFYSPIAAAVALLDAGLAIGIAILYLMALKHFKPQLKTAYLVMALASLLYIPFLLLLPITEYLDLWNNRFLDMCSYLPYLFASVLFFHGAWLFYRIAGLRQKTSPTITTITLFAAVLVADLLFSHANTWPNTFTFYAMQVIAVIPIVGFSVAASLISNVAKNVGKDYRKPFAWLTIGLLLHAFAAITTIAQEVTGYNNWYFNTRLYMLPTILADIAILVSGYYFNVIGLPEAGLANLFRKFFNAGVAESDVSSPDIVVYAANMTSDRAAIDGELEQMRFITAKLRPGEKLNQHDQAILKNVYLNIEHYLINSDKLRRFTRAELRSNITQHFGLEANSDNTFWPLLKS